MALLAHDVVRGHGGLVVAARSRGPGGGHPARVDLRLGVLSRVAGGVSGAAHAGGSPHVPGARRVKREHVALQADLVGLFLAATRAQYPRLKEFIMSGLPVVWFPPPLPVQRDTLCGEDRYHSTILTPA